MSVHHQQQRRFPPLASAVIVCSSRDARAQRHGASKASRNTRVIGYEPVPQSVSCVQDSLRQCATTAWRSCAGSAWHTVRRFSQWRTSSKRRHRVASICCSCSLPTRFQDPGSRWWLISRLRGTISRSSSGFSRISRPNSKLRTARTWSVGCRLICS